jgi:hypothetical protein
LIFDNKKAGPVVTHRAAALMLLGYRLPYKHLYCSIRFFDCQPFCIPFRIPQMAQKARFSTIGTAEKASKKP